MGRQSSRLYFQGKDHKDIYYNGHYHDAMYLSDSEGNVTLVWEKLKGVPLEGFTAICYYGGYYYVAYWDGTFRSDVLLYSGKKLDELEHIHTVSRSGLYQNLYVADQYGFNMIVYSEILSDTNITTYHFDYLDNGKLNTSAKYNLDNPVNVAGGANLYFLYKRAKLYVYTNARSDYSIISVIGDGGFTYTTDKLYMDIGSTFVFESNIIAPVQPIDYSAYPTMAERNYLYMIVCDLGGNPELKEIKIPSTIIDALYNEAHQKWKEAYPQYDISKEEAVLTYNLIERAVISNGYLVYQDVSITTHVATPFSSIEVYHNADIRIDLDDFSVASFKIKDDHTINVISKFVCDEYSITVFQKDNKETSIRYTLIPDYDAEINIKNIKNIGVLGANERDIKSNLKFVATYRKGDYLYYSIYNFNNYLLEIDMKNNKAAIIQPTLYLKEE